MGITGLIPFLEKASKKIDIKDLRGSTVAVDTYSWLHKGAIGCADKLSRGEDSNIYITYCLKYVDLLLSYDIKPILVFDGRYLPAKAITERRRRELRKESKIKAAELLRKGKIDEARSHLRRCVDISHEMALKLIKRCREMHIDCLVAPYEADAQMAYLNKINIAQYVVTEDSDLVLFGCQKIVFKLDLKTGTCLLVESSKLHLAMGCKPEKYSFDKFRNMCILSGCDYLDSLRGIGLAKALKFVLLTEETDIKKALMKIPKYLNMPKLVVTEEYIKGFCIAEATFKHMYVYDPIIRKQVRLYDPSEYGTNMEYLCNAGELLDDETAFQLALGNLDPFTLKKLDDWNPDQSRKINSTIKKANHKSIWDYDFKPHNSVNKRKISQGAFQFKKIEIYNPEDDSDKSNSSENERSVLSMYTESNEPVAKKHRQSSGESDEDECKESVNNTVVDYTILSQTNKNHNPFVKASPIETISTTNVNQSSLIRKLKPVSFSSTKNETSQISKFKRTVIDPNVEVKSRFFALNHTLVRKSLEKRKDVSTMEEDLKVDEQEKDNEISEIKDLSDNFKAEKIGETSENDIIEITNSIQTQIEQASVLYDSILSSPDKANTLVNPSSPNEITSSCDSGISSTTQNNNINFLEKFRCTKNKDICDSNNPENTSENANNEKIVKLSDSDDSDNRLSKKSSQKNKKTWPRTKVKQVGLSKVKKNPSTQSLLSRFGFQKRPVLK